MVVSGNGTLELSLNITGNSFHLREIGQVWYRWPY